MGLSTMFNHLLDEDHFSRGPSKWSIERHGARPVVEKIYRVRSTSILLLSKYTSRGDSQFA